MKSKSSHLIDEGTFIFTDYELRVTDILKNNATAPIEHNGVISFTGQGGAIELDGRTIRAIDYRNEPLLEGESYLIYLRFIPDTNSYEAAFNDIAHGDTFQIKDGVIIQASKKNQPLRGKRTTDAAPFMNEVHSVLNQHCSE